MAKGKPVAEPQIVSEQKQAAKALGISDRALRLWMREASFPDVSRGYDLAAIRAWRETNKRAGSEAREQAQQLHLALKKEKVAQEAIKTAQMERKLAEQEGELLPRETLELAIATIGTKSGDCQDQMPDILRGVCCKTCRDRVSERLKKELDRWRTDLVEALATLRSQ
jgi:DNA-binding transcriptional MerR regulator